MQFIYKRVSAMLIFVMVLLTTNAQLKPALADSFLNFIKTHPQNAALFIQKNDTTVAALNENKVMPLASTVKIIVAIEFAKQAAAGVIDMNSMINISELNKYYVPNTDGNAHQDWLNAETKQKNIKDNTIKLLDVARGMIIYSSNANTEYLMDILGFDNVKNNIQLFGLKQHTVIYPIVSALFMYQNPKGVKEATILKAIKKMNEEKYCRYIAQIHAQLKIDTLYKSKFRLEDLTEKMQKMWSDRLPASTTKEYVQIAKILNNRKFLTEDAFAVLAEVLEFPMENKGFQQVFKHYGVKGGSTAFVLTHVIYLTKKDGTKMELAIFFNDLKSEDQQKLEEWLDPFEAQVMFDKKFILKLPLNSTAK
jgi:D-alanyl-D-alanine carboxypeptidase